MGAAVTAGSVIFIFVTLIMAIYYVTPASQLSNSWDTRLSGSLADAITCNATVKSFGAEAREAERLDWVLGRWRKRTHRTWMRGTTSFSVQSAALLLLQLLITATVAFLWWHGRANAGDVTTVLATYFVLNGYLRTMGQSVREMQRGINDMTELVGIMALQPEVQDHPGASSLVVVSGRVEFDRVSFHYSDHTSPLFQDLSISIAAGERVGLVGPSGSGKSTFVRLIQRLHDVNGGRITIDGQDIAGVTQRSLRSQIAIVPQEPILFHRSLAENIAYGRPHASLAEIEEAARQAHAHDFIAALPRGYATLVGRARRETLRRRTPARRHRARLPCRRANPHSRRSDLEPGFAKRSADPIGDRTITRRAHRHRHRPPSLHSAQHGPHSGFPGRKDRGTGYSRGGSRPSPAAFIRALIELQSV